MLSILSLTMDLVSIFSITALLWILHGAGTLGDDGGLVRHYYLETCPLAEELVRRTVEIAVRRDPRMAASLLRLQFHDCFVMGCDGSVLLDSFGDIVSEKQAVPNLHSLRGFDVIDDIKCALEEACPLTVSCADIIAIAARDAVSLRGGPRWEVWLGRRDSLTASVTGANKFIPSPNSTLEALISSFRQQGLGITDLVALSGSHTMGKARCVSFRQRIYNSSGTDVQHGGEYGDHFKRDTTFRKILRVICPVSKTDRDNALTPLDFETPAEFDNRYYYNLLQGRGLLPSDQALLLSSDDDDDGKEEEEEDDDVEDMIRRQVWAYAQDQLLFFSDYVHSMIKMGNINVLTGVQGEVRKNCRFVNSG